MKFNELTLKDKFIFEKYLKIKNHKLSSYNFANIFIWKPLYKIFWLMIEKNLCLFFRDKIGCFMYLPPLGKDQSSSLINECFKIMDSFNTNPCLSRIENVEEKDLSFYRALGYTCIYKASEYVCLRQKLVDLKGNQFKSKRASYNYFVKNYFFEYRPLTNKDKESCLRLYKKWMRKRRLTSLDSVYRGMLDDSFLAQKIALGNHDKLGLIARVVKVDGEISAYTLGFPLNPQTFCILFETTDLNIKGIAQFIFREFARELTEYRYINIMDDLGLANLAKVKLSYKPVELIAAYIVERNG
ncbi:MAG: phosphatidylglycerol lysyltransferase domain-containing protein [Candidatus Omnitrophica bacterium]|nr:phosphatidylglycerol lysyltransferase domain-containing protein [Candidatus Omnitrophota bacterium]